MKKKVFGRKLGRERDSRRALFRGLIISLIENGSVKTTLTKAKAVIPEIDGVVNLAKEGSTTSLRRLYASLGNNKAATKKLSLIASKMDGRVSGYSRMTKIGVRQGDMAEVARIEWVDDVALESKEKKTKEAAKKKIVKRQVGKNKTVKKSMPKKK